MCQLAIANQNVFRIAISKWYDYNKQKGFNNQYFNLVNNEIKQLLNIQITFDCRYADAIRFWIHFRLCTAFNQIQQFQIQLDIYLKMASYLYKQKMIGKRHLLEIQSIKPFKVVQKIADITKQMVEGKTSVLQLEQKWMATFGLPLLQFWQIIMLKQIKHTILLDFYKVIEKAPIMLGKKNIKKYIEDLKNDKQKCVNSLSGNSKVAQQFRELQDMLEQKTISNSSNINLNTEQIDLSQQHVESLFSKISLNQNFDQLVEEKLKSTSYENSLFQNPAHTEIQKNLQLFINFVGQSIFHHKDYTLQTFGSLRSTLALSNQYDIDITFISSNPTNNQRKVSVSHLFKIYYHLKNMAPSWYKQSRVYCFPALPIPYLKIEVDELEFKDAFSIKNTTKIDITIDNRSAVQNSDLLLHFAKIPEIHSFCILVKFWAKARNIINLQHPMKGLSSYMLMLMCIYYLMQSGQIDFLQAQEVDVTNDEEAIIVPNLKRIQVESISDNFIGFLQFYKQTGRFQREKKVVCLLKNGVPQGYEFDQNIIVNAYDFIDKSNPGRLVTTQKGSHFREFYRALSLLKSNNLRKIDELFEKY